jgi:hypothetical protein
VAVEGLFDGVEDGHVENFGLDGVGLDGTNSSDPEGSVRLSVAMCVTLIYTPPGAAKDQEGDEKVKVETNGGTQAKGKDLAGGGGKASDSQINVKPEKGGAVESDPVGSGSGAGAGAGSLVLEWVGGHRADMVADAIVATVLMVEGPPMKVGVAEEARRMCVQKGDLEGLARANVAVVAGLLEVQFGEVKIVDDRKGVLLVGVGAESGSTPTRPKVKEEEEEEEKSTLPHKTSVTTPSLQLRVDLEARTVEWASVEMAGEVANRVDMVQMKERVQQAVQRAWEALTPLEEDPDLVL